MDAIGALARFSRMLGAASSSRDLMPLLVDAAVDHLGVAAAAVVAIADNDVLELVALRNLPDALRGRRLPSDAIDDDLAVHLRAAAGDVFAHARAVPLVSSVGLHGALVLFSEETIDLDPGRTELLTALVDLAAVASSRSADLRHLEQSYAELRASRDAMARTEKLRALGQMAAGVAHDLKNILNPMALQLELLRRRVDRGDRERALETIVQLDDVVRLGVDTVERLRDFSRQDPETAAEPVDLADVVTTALEICQPRVSQAAALTLHRDPGSTPIVLARAAELVTAIVNLVINAADALPDGGTITVRTGADADGGWVEVADDGPGMSPETERRVFEPFFTTKGEHGTGLGLSMVYAFVQRHGGRVTLDTAPGKGARFRLWFPAAR